ncbi:MAG: methyltransferase domain-containing protein [Terriglobales bacterium]
MFLNYREQAQFINHSRFWGGLLLALLGGLAGAIVLSLGPLHLPLVIGFATCVAATAASLYYTPDYLHLSVNPEKAPKWALKIRGRIIGGVLLLGLALAPSSHARISVLGAVAALTATLLVARKLPLDYLAFYFWVTDVALLIALAKLGPLDPHLVISFLAAAAHLSIVIVRRKNHVIWWTAFVFITGALVLSFSAPPAIFGLALSLLAVSVIGTAFLAMRTINHHQKAAAAALTELVAFTGYPAERVQQLWHESHKELAKNWQAAAIPENDHVRMKEWYRQNSGLYLFNISSHNLEYKKLISNLRMLRMGNGACLDYGAGNGEIVLEWAARGHAATYFDVDGETLRFARWRSEQRQLAVEFATTKEELRKNSDGGCFDTIFSFDVLEHLPDLEGELGFLASLLKPGGVLLCDVPAGATKNHPMHLNHRLDVADYLRSHGLTDRRSLLQRLTFAREKYIFQRN